MYRRMGMSVVTALAIASALAAPAAAQATTEVVAEGLNNPRGIVVADDGSLYVAEAGTTGETCIEAAMGDAEGAGGICYGPTGSVARVTSDGVERVIEGLTSAGTAMDAGGVSDVALADDGSIFLIMNLGGDPAIREGMPEELSLAGWLVKASPDGTLEPVADIAAFEAAEDPDADMAGQVDSNPYAIELVAGGVAVADAGGNDIVLAADDGSVSLLAVLPPTVNEIPASALAGMGPPPEGEGAPEGEPAEAEAAADTEGGSDELIPIPVQSVPTSVVRGPDGALYVGELTGGPFPVGGASVWRVADGEEPTKYATGFSAIMGLDFGPDDTLYVAEMVHEGLAGAFMGQPPVGAVMSVPAGGGEPTLVATGEQLMALGGLAVDADGAVYVTTGTIMGPGSGTVVKITP